MKLLCLSVLFLAVTAVPSTPQERDSFLEKDNRLYQQVAQFAEPPTADQEQDGPPEDDEDRLVDHEVYANAIESEEQVGGVFYEGFNMGKTEQTGGDGLENEGDGGDGDVNSEAWNLDVQSQGGGLALAQWNNHLHRPFQVLCGAGFGIYKMQSVFIPSSKDRRFLFTCNRVAPICLTGNYNPAARSCQWRPINSIGKYGSLACPTNYYLAGIKSTGYCSHDRAFQGLCCVTPRVCMRSCQWTGYLNSPGSTINYAATGKAVAGMISIYNNQSKDRQYRLMLCTIVAC